MRKGEDFSAGVVPREVVAILNERSDVKGLVHLAGHLLLILIAGALVYTARGTWWMVPVMFILGIPIVFLFTTLHETIHRTAFRTRWLNDGVAWMCGLAIGLPPNWFRAFHFAHHRHTQLKGKDPELDGKKADTWGDYLVYLSGWRYWAGQARNLIVHAAGKVDAQYVAPRIKMRVVREARIFLCVYGAIALGSIATGFDGALVYWVLPSLLAQPVLRAYLLAEHTGCAFVESMMENTRTTFTLAPVRFIAWNMPFHTEHHALPGVPFHSLPALHQKMKESLVNTCDGYVEFHREHIASL